MKRHFITVFILLCSFLVFACSNEKAIKETISDFEDAVNDQDADAVEDLMSPDSDFFVTGTFSDFLDTIFVGFIPVDYFNLDIDIDGKDAEVLADATYNAGATPDDVWFWMKKEEGFFSFLNPDWRIFRYYNGGDFDTPVWQKSRKPKIVG